MKYANIGHLTENYLDEGEMYEEEPEIEAAEDELPPEAGEDLPVDDIEDLGGEEEAIADTSEASVEALVDALADTITSDWCRGDRCWRCRC